MSAATDLSFNYHLIRKKRKELKVTQAKLAEIVGVSQGMISQIENGDLSPGFKTAIAIMIALELKPDDLLIADVESA